MNKQQRKVFHEYFMEQMASTHTVFGIDYNLLDLGWIPGYNNTKRSIGRCRYGRKLGQRIKRIEISNQYLSVAEQNRETMRDTVLHEIAHAIDIEIRGTSSHDFIWKRIAREVGADPRRTTDQIKQPEGKYKLVCRSCNRSVYKYRRPTLSRSCGKCGVPGRYDAEYKMDLVYTHNNESTHYGEEKKTNKYSNFII